MSMDGILLENVMPDFVMLRSSATKSSGYPEASQVIELDLVLLATP